MGEALRLLSIGHSRTSSLLLTAAAEGCEPARYILTESEYQALGAPAVGDLIDAEAADRLRTCDEIHHARAAAFRILAFGDNNRAALIRKLRARGFTAERSSAVADEMIARGYIREDAQVERAVLSAVGKLWGARRIQAELVAKGYPREAVADCLDRLVADGTVDFAEVRRRLIEKKLGSGATPAALRALLYRYGHTGGEE